MYASVQTRIIATILVLDSVDLNSESTSALLRRLNKANEDGTFVLFLVIPDQSKCADSVVSCHLPLYIPRSHSHLRLR